MLIKVLLGMAAFCGLIILLKILIRTIPELFDNENMRTVREKSNYMMLPPGMRLKSLFLFQLFTLGIPVIVPALVKREKTSILKSEMNKLSKVMKCSQVYEFQYVHSFKQLFEEQMSEYDRLLQIGSFEYSSMLAQLKGIHKVSHEFEKKLIEVDSLLVSNFELIQHIYDSTDDPSLEENLTEMNERCDTCCAEPLEFGNVFFLNRLINDLRKMNEALSNEDFESASSVNLSSDSSETYYQVLSVSSSATEKEIKSAYRKMALKYHPDRKAAELNKLTDEDLKREVETLYEDKLKSVNGAYDVLKDPQKRAEYDQFMR